jgi:putative lipoprotein
MKTSIHALITLVPLICLSGCSRSEKDAATNHITGNLTYGEPVTLAAGSVLELRLTDVSISDGPALEIANATVTDIRALPYRYSLSYDATKVNPQHRYTIDARILVNGTLRFATDTAYEVLTQGHGAQRDITVIASGAPGDFVTSVSSASSSAMSTAPAIFQNELRTANEVSAYKAGLQEGHITWLEEDRSSAASSTSVHARYEFKGALVTHYSDSTSLEIKFDERGRPVSISKNQQALALNKQTDVINAVRNRAALLRSHALAASETRAHRLATGG